MRNPLFYISGVRKLKEQKEELKTLPLEEFPTMKEVDDMLEGFLRYIYEDDFDKFVLKQDTGRFLLVTKGYRYYSPIAITTVSHPDDEKRALFINIERSFPIANEIELVWLSNVLGENFSLKYEEIERSYNINSGEKKYSVRFVTVTARLHALSIKDSSWFYLTLSKMLKIDNLILGEVKVYSENYSEYNKIRGKEENNSVDFT